MPVARYILWMRYINAICSCGTIWCLRRIIQVLCRGRCLQRPENAGAEIVRQKNKKAPLWKLFIHRYDIVIIVQCDGVFIFDAEDFMREGA